jgi:presenilin-like A22 family membrane protease
MKVLYFYMVLASASLLGILSSYMFQIAVDRYRLDIDKLSFALVIFNFGCVGTAAIFYPHGIPKYISQGYLIATSVIVAWQLSHFDPWTAWGLLVMLALYDLFAVLTPCGPLKALVKLMQRKDAPQLPGLLYEATLEPNAASRNGRATTSGESATNGIGIRQSLNERPTEPGQHTNTGEEPGPRDDSDQDPVPHGTADAISSSAAAVATASQTSVETIIDPRTGGVGFESQEAHSRIEGSDEAQPGPGKTQTVQQDRPSKGSIPLVLALVHHLPIVHPNQQPREIQGNDLDSLDRWTLEELQDEVEVDFPENGLCIIRCNRQRENEETRYALLGLDNKVKKVLYVSREGVIKEDLRYRARSTGKIPLAIARLNKLRFAQDPQPSWVRRSTDSSVEDHVEDSWSAEALQQEVDVVFPRNGWTIVRHSQQKENEATRYAVIGPDGSLKRVLFVTSEGLVFEDFRDKNRQADEEERKKERTSIKLGLGDFIFYSILVSKAALYSFTTFCACTLAILIGLALTLGILAVRGKALPALPISIFLGVAFYLLTRYSMEPWIQEIFIQRAYV